jgi:Trypsin
VRTLTAEWEDNFIARRRVQRHLKVALERTNEAVHFHRASANVDRRQLTPHPGGISDIGLCFLDEPVLGIRAAKLGNRSLDHHSVPGRRMTIVGYGTTAPPPGGPADTSNYEGIRRWGRSSVDQVVDENWVTFNRDPVTVCFGDSGAPTFFNGRVVAIASDGAADCASADVRARVDSKEVRTWIKSQIHQRFTLNPDARLSRRRDFTKEATSVETVR